MGLYKAKTLPLFTCWTHFRIGHVRYINILTWLRGFQVKLLYLVLFSLCPSLFWELRDKGNLKNLQFWPESLGAMLEYWYIERGLLGIYLSVFCWRALARQHPILCNSERKAKSVGCKIEFMRSRLCFLNPGILGCLWMHVETSIGFEQ